MPPSRRSSSSSTPGHQKSIASFFSNSSPSSASPQVTDKAVRKPVLRIPSLLSPEPEPPGCNIDRSDVCPLLCNPTGVEHEVSNGNTRKSLSHSPAQRKALRYPVDAVNNKSVNLHSVKEDEKLLVGRRLKVYWPLDNEWYPGFVKSYNKLSGLHLILYDDGESEELRLDTERVNWLEDSKDESPIKRGHRSSRKNKRKASVSGKDLPGANAESCEMEADVSHETLSASDKAHENHEGVVTSPEFPHLKRLKRGCRKLVTYTEQDLDETVEDGHFSDENCEENTNALVAERDSDSEDPMDVDIKLPKKQARYRRLVKKTGKETSKEKSSPLDKAGDERQCESQLKKSGRTTEKVQKVEFHRNRLITLSESAEQRTVMDCFTREEQTLGLNVQCPKIENDVLLAGEVAERFGARVAGKFKFLGKNRRDAAGRRPDDPLFDARTLFLPSEFLNSLTGVQRQWWEFKSKHMDKVLFFKMGKFYELFEMDAHIGAQELDLQYMKGDQPHCGFPEKNYSDNVEKLARKGFRVLVVEQTETPDQLEQRRKETGVRDKVVNREICAIITKGTMVDGDMVAANPDSAFLLAISETSDKESSNAEGSQVIGLCAVDSATSLFLLGQFVDDQGRTRLRAVLSELRPVELIKPRGMLSLATERALKEHTKQPLLNNLEPVLEFWNPERSLKEAITLYSQFNQKSLSPKPSKGVQAASINLGCNFQSANFASDAETLHFLPDLLFQVARAGKRAEAALSAFGGCLSYLRMVMLDESLLHCGRFMLLPCSDKFSMSTTSTSSDAASPATPEMCARNSQSTLSGQNIPLGSSEDHPASFMFLDSAALENLEILENNYDGGTSGSLLGLMDHCVTAFGRRLLKQWLVRPLLDIDSIKQRQHALSDLQGPAENAASRFRKELQGLPDMERLLARLITSCGGSGRNSQSVVLYEDAAKKQLKEFLTAVRGCRMMLNAICLFESCADMLVSTRLKFLVTVGDGFPNLASYIRKFEASFDWSEADKNGRIIPCSGVDEAFDSATLLITNVQRELENYREQQCKIFGNSSEIKYVTVGKDSYQLEIPDHLRAKVPLEYEASSSKKGYQRYTTPRLKGLLQELAAGEVQKEAALKGIFRGLLVQFCEIHRIWFDAVKAIAEIDALVSLSMASTYMEGQVCLPTFLDQTKPSEQFSNIKDTPFFKAKALRHPSIGSTLARGGSFVPNDVILGGQANAPLILLTGPNMGGKSTLLRQICLAVILAQVGAYVPAEEFQLSPVDRVFVRMGARDHIMAGKSTFLLELSEASSMLRFASKNSLVALDELGRGTSTSDGQAIAYAVLDYLARNIGCLGMFSSHYHRLTDELTKNAAVASYHMACKVGTGAGGLEEVTFLYKLTCGPCPKSYGVNVARLAGMPQTVLERATKRSSELEYQEKSNAVSSTDVTKNAAVEMVTEILDFLKHQALTPIDSAGFTVLWQKVRQFFLG